MALGGLSGRLITGVFPRYLATSVAALAADFAVFVMLLGLGTIAAAASAASYMVGIVVHWLLSSRTVFVGAVAERGLARTRQKVEFFASALVGLALTTAIVAVGTGNGFDPRLAKLAAVGTSFTVTWWLRRTLVFRATPA